MANLNLVIFNAIHQFAGKSRFLDGAGLFFASTLTYLLVLAAIYFLWRLPGWRRRIFAAGEILLAVLLSRGIIAEGIRYFYKHPRPFEALGFKPLLLGENPWDSMPSGHMTGLFALAMVLYFINKKWGIWYMVLSLLVGIARIFVGVHWPLDIAAGILIGIACGYAVERLVRNHWRDLTASQAPAAEKV